MDRIEGVGVRLLNIETKDINGYSNACVSTTTTMTFEVNEHLIRLVRGREDDFLFDAVIGGDMYHLGFEFYDNINVTFIVVTRYI